MARRLIVKIKGPQAMRGWVIAAEDDDPLGAVAHFIVGDDDTLREHLGIAKNVKLPTVVEIQVNQLYFKRLLGQVVWR